MSLLTRRNKAVVTCTATQLGTWLGHPPTGRRFEDNQARVRQLGLTDQP